MASIEMKAMDSKQSKHDGIITAQVEAVGDSLPPVQGKVTGAVSPTVFEKRQYKSPEEFLKRHFHVEIGKSKYLMRMGAEEELLEGLKRMADEQEDSYLINRSAGNCGVCTRHTILQGSVGCGTKNGRTHFIPPGNYFRLGFQTSLTRVAELTDEKKAGTYLEHMDLSYVILPENHVAVVQVSDEQVTLASGRYLIRKPAIVYGICDIQNLKQKVQTYAYTEQLIDSKDVKEIKHGDGKYGNRQEGLKKVVMKSGEYETIGSLTFIRAEPGFAYIVQDADGRLSSGIGFTVVRGGQVFKDFVDMQHHARSTRWFNMESKDRQVVKTRVIVRWKIVNPVTWTQRKGTCHDIFNAVEENIQALMLENISGNTYEECMAEAGKGFTTFERTIKPKLTAQIESLGGRLLGSLSMF